VGLTVVEPFAGQSELKLPDEVLHNNSWTNTLKLHDYVEIDYWNERSSEWDVPPLETWENFILHSTKKIVVVIMSHFGAGGTFVNDELLSHPNCLKWKKWGFFLKNIPNYFICFILKPLDLSALHFLSTQ